MTGTSKGKGFAGTMKRHGFRARAPATARRRAPLAGFDRRLRHPGPGVQGHPHVGPDGHDRVTTQNLMVHKVDAENGVLLIKGAIPGPQRRTWSLRQDDGEGTVR